MGNFFTDIYESTLTIDQIVQKINNLGQFGSIDDCELERLPEYAAVIAQNIKVTPTQLRRFYTYIKSVDLVNLHTDKEECNFKDKYKIKFLLPKIAGSSEYEKLKELYKILGACVLGEKIKSVKDFRMFMEFFEAILDYHSTFKSQKQDN
ncbi:MAG: type III-A CRISPR-associated protein Csm2 [Chlorobaculum sp.]|jgi:CRISPR type III-A-associated protein Csm2|nr:type III-A CRISPR-associated protein Csm2 [Chlorobaculum sp.]